MGRVVWVEWLTNPSPPRTPGLVLDHFFFLVFLDVLHKLHATHVFSRFKIAALPMELFRNTFRGSLDLMVI